MPRQPLHTTIHPDRNKFKELLLYVATKCENDPLFGATKLNKILFYADFYSFLLRSKPITGVQYQHLRHGPAPRMLLPARQELIRAGRAAEAKRMTPGGMQQRLVALEPPDLSGFDADEIALVDQVIEWLRDKNADEVSSLSHLQAGWQLTAEGEDIPYETAILNPKKPTIIDLRWARSKDSAASS